MSLMSENMIVAQILFETKGCRTRQTEFKTKEDSYVEI